MKRILQEIFKSSKKLSLFLLSLSIVQGVMSPVTVKYEQKIIDYAVQSLEENKINENLWMVLLVFVLAYAYTFYFPIALNLVVEKMKNRLDVILHARLFQKIEKINFSHLEDRTNRDLFSRLQNNIEGRAAELIKNICDLLATVVNVVGFFLIISKSSILGALSFSVFFVLLVVFADKAAKSFYKLNSQFSETERRVVYLDSIENTREYAHEKKLFGFTDYINNKRSDFLLSQRNVIRSYDYKYGLTFSLTETVGYICTILLMLILLVDVSKGMLSIGLFVSVSHAALNLNLLTQNSLRTILNNLLEQKIYWNELDQFLDLPDEGEKTSTLSIDKKIYSIEFQHVSFTYPAGTDVLHDVNFILEPNKRYALVGKNGSGKSTIVKLLLGLYTVSSGEILINGVNIQNFSRVELSEMFSSVFQDFPKYYVSIKENITLGKTPKGVSFIESVERAQLSNLISKLDEKENTLLGDIYDEAVNISGGEWQRVAFARALYRDTPVLLLDEPTSAMDPIAESEMYTNFAATSSDKLILFITHRLASTRMADEILVLDGGTIVQRGNHDMLIEQEGPYKKMYLSQQKWYEGKGVLNENTQ